MLKVCVEGWRGINHSYAVVNERQLIELSKLDLILKHRDLPFFNSRWNKFTNNNGFSKSDNEIIQSVQKPDIKENFDVVYRIAYPFNFSKINAKKLVIFGTSEYQNINNSCVNFDLKKINKDNQLNIVTPSKWSKAGFLNAGINEKKIRVIPHGVDSKTFFPLDPSQKKIFREKLKIKKEDFLISSIGAMTKNKGVEYLIIAFCILKTKYKNLKLVLKDQSNLYNRTGAECIQRIKKTEYSNIIKDNFLSDILFISENLDLNSLNELYNSTDCYVSSYMAEGFNLTPLEASACGTPILITKGGSTDDYFDKILGLQIESKFLRLKDKSMLEPNVDSLINSIEKIIINPNKYGGENGSKYTINNFSWNKIVHKLYEVLIR